MLVKQTTTRTLRSFLFWGFLFWGFLFLPFATSTHAEESDSESAVVVNTKASQIHPPDSVREARDRSKLLYETIHGMLQVVHRDLFDDEEAFAIPSHSFEDVFDELERTFDVSARWLVVNTDVLNVDHKPQNQFERDAVKALADGKATWEKASEGRFQFAGAIHLKSECLKCHVKRRISTETRTAGLVISMPIAAAIKATDQLNRAAANQDLAD